MSVSARAEDAPEGHHPVLHQAWGRGRGPLGWIAAVNHKQVGIRFIVTGLVFLVAGGVLALLMRTQLIVPDNELLGAEGFSEAFSMHGTTMMFLFAVPILEGFGMYMLPLLLGTRDAPFPRMNAFGYWCYLFGGLFVFSSFLFGDAPSEGWFVYVPLSGPEFSPGSGMDFWLLGITFVEISAIIGAIELLVAFFARRAPGMSINRIPIFGWAIAVMAGMILLAFPALLTGSVMLEVERVLGTRFFDAGAGGDPLLWQHLFWFFGHPEVYIMLIPAVGIVSVVVPVFSRRPLAMYPWVVAALLAIGLISFGLWVHHMFTTGLSLLGLSLFAAASFLIAIPSGIQVFAWLSTMWRGRPAFKTPMLFIAGFLIVFVLGGVTGVMVAAVPFDWQVHDSYFVVAHFHYVLVGGVVFPIFAGLYYWFPKWTGRLMSEALGKWSFWTMFTGFNVAFFPQHIAGLEGMPRRVFTYREVDGWETWNLISSVGAYILAIGVALTLINMVVALARGRIAGPNPWGAGTLEWAAASPPPAYNFQKLPVIAAADPLWHDSGTAATDDVSARAVDQLAAPATPLREVFETRAADARLYGIARLPGPSLWPVFSALAILFGLVGILAGVAPMIAVGSAAIVLLLIGWALDTVSGDPERQVERALPSRSSGAGVWGTTMALIPIGAILGSVLFSYLLLATDAESWQPAGHQAPPVVLGLVAAALAAAGAVAARIGTRASSNGSRGRLLGAIAGSAAAGLASAAALGAWWAAAGITPTEDAYSSVVAAAIVYLLVLAIVQAVVALVVAWQAYRSAAEMPPWASVRVSEALTAFLGGAVLITMALLILAPRIL